MLPERKTGGYRIRPYDIIDILYTNAAAGAHLQANAPPPYVMKLISPLKMHSRGSAVFCTGGYFGLVR